MNHNCMPQPSRNYAVSSFLKLLCLVTICFLQLAGCATQAAQQQPMHSPQQEATNPSGKAIEEQGYTIHAPQAAWGGEPFVVSVTGQRITQVTFTVFTL